jgi:hypothetical protein
MSLSCLAPLPHPHHLHSSTGPRRAVLQQQPRQPRRMCAPAGS